MAYERLKDLEEEVKKKEGELKEIQKLDVKEMWNKDLDTFLEVLNEIEEEEEYERLNAAQGKMNKKK
jgi:hypothetical protein